jgi:uncharacterized protein
VFIDVAALERRKIHFDVSFKPGAIGFGDRDWKQSGPLQAAGVAELLDRKGSRTIRVRGKIHGAFEGDCARCLERVSKSLDGDFDLFYYPMSMIARTEEVRINTDDTDLGFYEGRGLELGDIVREQVLLWMPMRVLCEEICPGICPQCGAKRGSSECSCEQTFVDPRWDALREYKSKWKQ